MMEAKHTDQSLTEANNDREAEDFGSGRTKRLLKRR